MLSLKEVENDFIKTFLLLLSIILNIIFLIYLIYYIFQYKVIRKIKWISGIVSELISKT